MKSIAAALLLGVFALPQDSEKAPSAHEALEAGLSYLLTHQRDDGSWGRDSSFGNNTGIRTAITALSIQALRAGKRVLPHVRIDQAVTRGLHYLNEHSDKYPKRPSQGLYNFSVYGSAFAAPLLAREQDEASRNSLAKCLDRIVRNQLPNGGYSYVHGSAGLRGRYTDRESLYESFATALTLEALWEVRKAGHEIPEETFQRGLQALQTARTVDEYFCYHLVDGTPHGSLSGNGNLSWPASIARTVSCEYILFKIGHGKREHLEKAVDKFFEHRAELEKVRKKDGRTHQGPFDCAPYYYLFGHYYACLAVFELGERFHKQYVPSLKELLLKIRERNGTWLDSRIGGRQYGCAMAVLTLSRMLNAREEF
ncbi:MAG: terpene cyclase/mutase family protein [Planctomycetes bacterium]|nr:terpene cyclase/mutase family protein [Planctomycetota bacterium]